MSILYSCSFNTTSSNTSIHLTENQKNIINSLPNNLVIAHRGTTYYAPEESEAAMRWARNVGADYLEFDLQRTKDGYLVAMHDENLIRTTDVETKFPDRKSAPVSSFTYEELLQLDIGKWFNTKYPERSRKNYIGLDILTLEDITQIAEGKRIKRNQFNKKITYKNKQGKICTDYENDPSDNGNRPGLYIETKIPALFPNIESDLKNELTTLGWYHVNPNKLRKIKTSSNKVQVANTLNRVILQTFSKESLVELEKTFTRPIPTCFLIYRGDEDGDLSDDSLFTFQSWVNFGKLHGATIIGPSIAGPPNNYADLLSYQHALIIKNSGLMIHGYSFDTQEQMLNYKQAVNGMFSNKADEALMFYGKAEISCEAILKTLGY